MDTSPPAARDLKQLSVEELMDVEVTSVSRKTQSLASAAAAVTVVSNEDIRRSGATSLPEALRLVPGLHVARENSNTWAVSSRGFSSGNSEKLLVLADTRSIYTPLFSGVLWDVQDFFLEDIERIEVIRGPGASLWGSNAVNGVINITSKSARDTQGLYAATGAGSEERTLLGLRYGGKLAEDTHYRVYGQYSDRDATFNTDPLRSDDWRIGHIGFRSDWEINTQDSLTLQAEAYHGTIGQLSPAAAVTGRPGPQGDLEVGVSGGHLLGHWRRSLDEGSDLQLRAYYDRTHRNDPAFHDDLDTLDLDFQHRFALRRQQELLWGLNYRYTSNRNVSKILFALEPPSSDDQLFSAFVQDQIPLTDAVQLTIGTKLEHNDFSGFEVQPSVRAVWDAAQGHSVWAAVSRAVRVPTRLERDLSIDASDPTQAVVTRLLGNDQFDSEKLLASELGYRWQTSRTLFIDVAAFYNRYKDLASLEVGTPFVDPQRARLIVPIISRNMTDGEAKGIETLVSFFPWQHWKLSATYSYVDLDLHARGLDLNRGRFLQGATPRHQFGLRSSLDLPGEFQVDVQLRTLSAIRSLPSITTGTGIPGYSELDLRVAWQASDRLEVSLVGQNLLHDRHVQFGSVQARGEIERGAYAKIVWRY